MLAKPNPTRLGKLVEDPDVENHRHLFCWWYDHCLDQAVAGNWASWTCEQCALFGMNVSSEAVAPGPSPASVIAPELPDAVVADAEVGGLVAGPAPLDSTLGEAAAAI